MRNPLELQGFAFSEGIAYLNGAMVMKTQDIARNGFDSLFALSR